MGKIKENMEVIKLYEMAEAFSSMDDMVDHDETLRDYLDSIRLQMQLKAENIMKFIRMEDVTVTGIDEEIKRLTGLKKLHENKSKNLRTYVQYVMEKENIQKLETPVGNFSLRKSKSLKVVDETLIPSVYFKEKVVRTLDKVKVKKSIEAGDQVSGALINYNHNLQIK